LDTRRIRGLGWRPLLTIEEALERTLSWFEGNRYAWHDEALQSTLS
jgi:dTDP-D-glucose 4,6-dehydratase